MEEELERDMTPKLIGETYLKKATPSSSQRYRFGIYECQYCNKEFEATLGNIRNKSTKSCGCQRGKGFKHGLESNRFYSTWSGLVARCTNPNNHKFYMYGARGITVCEEWLDIKNFVAWAELTHPNIAGVSLDRIDNDGAYSPENCRWANASIQGINQRMRKSNTSGFVGVYWHKGKGTWDAKVAINNRSNHLGSFKIKEEAVQARDNYIIENNLPHKLSTDYKREESQ